MNCEHSPTVKLMAIQSPDGCPICLRAERDAERYRWLRDNNWLNGWILDGSTGEWPGVIDRNIDADREGK